MKSKAFNSATGVILALLLVGNISAPAQNVTRDNFSGLINDYSPETTVSPTGPWEIRGAWQLTLQTKSRTANFSAELNMELSDYTIVCCGIDPDSPPARMPHTHLINLTGGHVTELTGGGFEITGGSLTILKNGSP